MTDMDYPHWICRECGIRYMSPGKQLPLLCTWHDSTCEVCGEKRPVTESRDFGHPEFPKRRKK